MIRAAAINGATVVFASLCIAGCGGGGATIGSAPIAIATTQPTIAPATPGLGSTSGATPAASATSGATAKTPASCVTNSTPAPLPVGGSLGMGKFMARGTHALAAGSRSGYDRFAVPLTRWFEADGYP